MNERDKRKSELEKISQFDDLVEAYKGTRMKATGQIAIPVIGSTSDGIIKQILDLEFPESSDA